MTQREYNIAVLLPTHKRTERLSRSLFSLVDRAQDLSSIEFLLAIDEDDTVAQEYFEEHIQPRLDELDVNYRAVGFEPMGYGGLNIYFDTLAGYASADWYFCWSDDAIMETNNWDQHIRECTGEFRLLKVHAHNEHPYSIFPIIPAEWRSVTGYLSKHQLIDAEVSQMAYHLDIMKVIDVWVTHDRHELTGAALDETANKKRYYEGNPNDPRDFHYPAFERGRHQDRQKLINYMREQGLDLTFWDNVVAGKQNPWQRMMDNDPNRQTGIFNFVKDQKGQVQMVPEEKQK